MIHRNLVAVDISDQSVKVLKLNTDYEVIAYGEGYFDEGTVREGVIVDGNAFSTTLNEVLDKTKPQALTPSTGALQSIVSLPESKLFVHYFVIPESIEREGVEAYIEEEAMKMIPFDLDELYVTHHLTSIGKARHVTFVGAQKEVVNNYAQALAFAGIRPAIVGGSFFSLGRAVLPDDFGNDNYMIVDIGAHATHIGIFDVDAIANLSVRVLVGGKQFTTLVAERLNVSAEEAEKLKVEHGLDEGYRDGTVCHILEESMKEIISEMKEAERYFEEKTDQKVTKLVLAGGSALMPGISKYIEHEMNVASTLADPFLKIKNTDDFGADAHAIFFTHVIGLALHGANKRLPGINLLAQYWGDEKYKEVQISIWEVRSAADAVHVAVNLFHMLKDALAAFSIRLQVLKKMHIRLFFTLIFMLTTLGMLVWVVNTYM